MRQIALLTLLAFGCTTVRQPATPLPAFLGERRVALAEPELELWMEGTGPIDAAESGRALEQTREALSQALAGRNLEASDPEELLVVRARAIARTDERKSAQVWSVVGIVLVVVAVVVIAIVTSRHSSPGKAGHGVRPISPLRPGPYAPAFLPRRYPPPPLFGVNFGLAIAVPLEPLPPPPWVTPTEAWLASRGWFDGDVVELTVELADARSGAVSWHRTVQEGIDPRDPGTMSELVGRALAGLPFGQKAFVAPHPDDLPPPPPPTAGHAAPVAPPEAGETPP